MNTWSLEACFRGVCGYAGRVVDEFRSGLAVGFDADDGFDEAAADAYLRGGGADAGYCPNCGATEGLQWTADSVYCHNCQTKSTYCPHCGADSGSCDGTCAAERLAEREALEDVAEPITVDEWRKLLNGAGVHMLEDSYSRHDPEPPLSSDELVGVRGLLQERRYEDQRPKWLTDLIDTTAAYVSEQLGIDRDSVKAAINRDKPPCDHQFCAKQGADLCFGVYAAQQDLLAAAERCRARKEKEPSNVATYCDEWAGHGGRHRHGTSEFWPNETPVGSQENSPAEVDGVPPHTPPPSASAGPPDWEGWAVPAICEVLAEHVPDECDQNSASGPIYCCGADHFQRCADWQEWREHVAPLIADRIACDPGAAATALHAMRDAEQRVDSALHKFQK